MYSEPDQQYYSSPKATWQHSTSKQRNAMLINAGWDTHRTLTLRDYDNLPLDVKVDLITVHNRSPRPVRFSSPNSRSRSGAGVSL